MLTVNDFQTLLRAQKEQNIPWEEFTTLFGIPLQTKAEDYFAHWQTSKQNLTFHTSGSTGTPKYITHSVAALLQEIESLFPHFKNKLEQALVCVPIHHLYGFSFGFLLPKVLDIPIKYISLPTELADQINAHTLVVGMPLIFRALLNLSPSLPFFQAITGTSPMDNTTWEKLKNNASVLEIFGSTETSVLATRTDFNAPYTLLPHFSRKNAQSVQRTLPGGTLSTYNLQDRLQWLTDTTFLPQGRLDFALQVAGVNVYPQKVAAYLLTHPKISACAIRLMHQTMRLKAFLVLKDAEPTVEFRRELRAFIKSGLSPAEQPIQFDFGLELPKNRMGKLCDW
ncbi:MAG: AMP-binding protein [Desulfovibrio sp.]|nr:AMP-binding protein [Desulfovibrio sp.]